jgi:hypothetical protein
LQQLIASPKLQIVGLWQLLARSEDEEQPSQRFKLIVKSTFLEFVQASWHILAMWVPCLARFAMFQDAKIMFLLPSFQLFHACGQFIALFFFFA